MRIAFYIAHPSQYYVFRNTIRILSRNKHDLFIFIKSKDVLERLLIIDGIDFVNIYPYDKKRGLAELIKSVIVKNRLLYKYIKRECIDILISAASESSQASFILGIPSVILNDDDYDVIRKSSYFGWPFSSVIIAPASCKMGYFKRKTISYTGYQKLAYLHPNCFKPDQDILQKYGLVTESYFIIRKVSFDAHHDNNIRGLHYDMISKLVETLSPHGKVLISSEKKLPEHLLPYELKINPIDIHNIIYYSSLLICDSQSMAQEAALLGTPSIRFNDFVGRIGVLEELEYKYQLTFGIDPDNPELLYQKANELAIRDNKNGFKERAGKMISENIDLTAFITWFIENYPQSKRIMQKNPDYQYNFR
jgi:predicted glycosyltransferase